MHTSQTLRRYILSFLTVLLTSVTLSAQSHPMSNTGPAGGSANPDYTKVQPNGADSSDPQKIWDRAFVKKILESDQAAIELGELAQQSSQNDGVKQFSQSMIEERKKFDTAIEPIATQLGVDRTTFSHRDKKEIAKLKALTGPKFDQEYLNLLSKESQQSLKDSNSEATKTPNTSLRDAAQENAKAATKRLEQIQSLEQSHNQASAR